MYESVSDNNQAQLQILSSAYVDTTPPSAEIANSINPQTNVVKVDNSHGQSELISPWPETDSRFSTMLNPTDTSSAAFHEPYASSVDTLNTWVPAPLPAEAQFTDFNDTNLSLTPFPAASDTVDLQPIFDMDSTVWWDPSLLYDASIGDVGQ